MRSWTWSITNYQSTTWTKQEIRNNLCASSGLCTTMMPLSQNNCVRELIRKVKVQLSGYQPSSVLENILVVWILQDGHIFAIQPEFPVPAKPNAKTSNMICANLWTSHTQGFFFLDQLFFIGGHRNFRLPRNLENLANISDEIIQTNFEFEFFWHQNQYIWYQI
jgi:hypothetical protein